MHSSGLATMRNKGTKSMTKKTGNDLFILDNSDDDWKVLNYPSEWSEISRKFDIATGYFEIGALLALDGKWQKLDQIRILMGDEVAKASSLFGSEITWMGWPQHRGTLHEQA